jgi:hypothetical protein
VPATLGRALRCSDVFNHELDGSWRALASKADVFFFNEEQNIDTSLKMNTTPLSFSSVRQPVFPLLLIANTYSFFLQDNDSKGVFMVVLVPVLIAGGSALAKGFGEKIGQAAACAVWKKAC